MPSKPQIVVFGANGMLGSVVSEYLASRQFEVVRVTRELFNVLTSPLKRLEGFICSADQVVVNCIVHEVRSSNWKETVTVNSLFPRQLSYLCAHKGAKLIHISSNAVFSGATGNYQEDEVPDPKDLYGLSKLLAETDNCMVLRTSILGMERFSNRYLLQWAISQRDKQVRGFTNHYWNGVTTLTLVEAIENIILAGLYTNGVFHLHSRESMSKCELLRVINDAYALDLDIVPGEAEQSDNKTLSSIYSLSSLVVRTSIVEQLKTLKDYSIIDAGH